MSAYEDYCQSKGRSYPLANISRFAGLVYATLDNLSSNSRPAQMYGPDSERGRLGKEIVRAFANSVAAEGASYVVMRLPRYDHFRQFLGGQKLPWRFLLESYEDAYHFINAEDFLSAKYRDDSYYQPGWHYGPEINLRIAEAVAADLLACIADSTCISSRLQGLAVSQRP